MKKLMSMMAISSLLFISACSNDNSAEKPSETVSNQLTINEETLVKEQNGITLDIVIPKAEGMKNTEKQNEINAYFLELGKALETETRASEEAILEGESINPDMHAEGTMNFEVKSKNEKFFSVLIHQFSYSGGAHGNSVNIPFTYSLQQEKELMLSDLFEDENYLENVSANVREKIEKSDIKDMFFEPFGQINPDEKFYLTDDALVIVFDPYEYTAGAAGIPEFSIEKTELKHLKEDFK